MDRALWINKAKASGIHLAISMGIFLVFVYILLFIWYPLPYFHSDGGWQGMRIMLYVDVVLGPLLTLIVYNYKKPRNKIIFDLSVIAMIQIGALIWGVNAVYNGRPVAIVYNEGRFHSQEARGFSELGVDISEIKGSESPPIFVIAKLKGRADGNARIKLYNKGFGELQIISTYETVAENIDRFADEDSVLNFFLRRNEPRKKMLEQYLKNNNKKQENLIISNYVGKFSGGLIIFDKQGKYIDTLIDP